mgnify:FL=1
MNRTVFIGLLGVAAIVLAVGLTFWRDVLEEKAFKEVAQAPVEVPEHALGLKSDGSAAATEGATKADSPHSTNAPAPAEEKPIVPSFDIVRVNQEGDAVIAGRAEPEAIVTVYDGKTVIGTIVADQKGEWVMVPAKPLPAGDRALSVVANNVNGDKLESKDVVILAVPESKMGKEKPLAVLVPRTSFATEKVLQKPRISPEGQPNALSLEIVDYDEAGWLRLKGHANPANTVIVYMNNNSIGQAVVNGQGTWELRPADTLARGAYTLRLDEVDETQVIARIELPFARALPPKGLTKEEYVTVQPGNSLWRISRRILGEGTMYTVIYEANKNQIRDANLIYPGQIFSIPRAD